MGRKIGRNYTRIVAEIKPLRGGSSTSATAAEKNKQAWDKANAGLPDNAFADNVVVDESHGVYYPKSLQMEIDTNDTQII